MKITNVNKTEGIGKVTFKTSKSKDDKKQYKWWEASKDKDAGDQLLSTAAYLKEAQSHLYKQASVFSRLYGNLPLSSMIGNNIARLDNTNGLPLSRPTYNVIQSAADTLISKLTQSRPAPVFLTQEGDYKERRKAKQLNNFIQGEFYQTKTYDKTAIALRDALVLGTGVLKVFSQNDKVALERVMPLELLIDHSEAIHGEPRQMYQMKLVDRAVLKAGSPKYKAAIDTAENAYADNSADSSRTVADLVMVVEGWHLPSGPDAKDGRHIITTTSGIILDEPFTKDKFPFVFMHYSPRMLGFWSQGLAEQLTGVQIEINSLLHTISRAIKLVGVPRIFVEMGSKVNKAAFNDEIGTIIEYQGSKPLYEVAPAVPQEMYAQLDRMIEQAYRRCGVSSMQASSVKPSGLNSGEAIRSYDDIATDRFAALSRRYDNLFIDLAYLMVDAAMDIAKDTGSYQTIYPNKDGTKEIDLPNMDLLQDPFVIQVFNQSSLPKDPSGRMQKITEMIQAGMISIKEGRRLLDYPDLDQVEKLANASEERIFQILDKIVEDGEYTPPDPFMDIQLANDLTVQYYNLYTAAKLEEDRAQMLRDFYSQVQALKQAAMPPAPVGAPNPAQASAAPLPVSPLVPNANTGMAA